MKFFCSFSFLLYCTSAQYFSDLCCVSLICFFPRLKISALLVGQKVTLSVSLKKIYETLWFRDKVWIDILCIKPSFIESMLCM